MGETSSMMIQDVIPSTRNMLSDFGEKRPNGALMRSNIGQINTEPRINHFLVTIAILY